MTFKVWQLLLGVALVAGALGAGSQYLFPLTSNTVASDGWLGEATYTVTNPDGTKSEVDFADALVDTTIDRRDSWARTFTATDGNSSYDALVSACVQLDTSTEPDDAGRYLLANTQKFWNASTPYSLVGATALLTIMGDEPQAILDTSQDGETYPVQLNINEHSPIPEAPHLAGGVFVDSENDIWLRHRQSTSAIVLIFESEYSIIPIIATFFIAECPPEIARLTSTQNEYLEALSQNS